MAHAVLTAILSWISILLLNEIREILAGAQMMEKEQCDTQWFAQHNTMDGIVKERGIILEDAKAYRTRIGGLHDAKEGALQCMADHGEHNREETAHTKRKMERYQFERAALNWQGGHGTMELDDDGPKEDQRAQKKMPKWTLEADFADNSFVNQEDANDPWTSNKTTDEEVQIM